MKSNILKCLFLCLMLFCSFEVRGETRNVLKLSCEYDPSLIKKTTINADSSGGEELNIQQICRSLNCKDIIEVYKNDKSKNEDEYRLRNSWFNHQVILLDDFLLTDNTILINTFVSNIFIVYFFVVIV